MDKKAPKIIISGGGTGGHIFPALSIAKAIERREGDAEILFVGAHGRMEMEKVPNEGYQIIGLPIAGFQRKNMLKNLTFFPKLAASLFKCKSLVKSFKPDVVIGVGGYASGPLLRTAQNMGIPTLIQEQNSYAGVTNKLLSKKAKKICVAYDKMDRYFPENKILLTGNPIRKDLLNISEKKDEALNHFGLSDALKTVLIVGGSQGAFTINESIKNKLEDLIRKKVQVIWQTGEYYYDTAREALASYQKHYIQVTKFIGKMDLAFAAADYIISRAGAGTISELSLVGKPVILVPSPNVAEDHQTKNAQALVDKDAAILVNDKEAREKLVPTLFEIMGSVDQQVLLGVNISKLAKPNADELIVDEVFKLIK
jgi:UDP-N-acetylglucosamine--N-acetylmuramyl-(pentapeptide) pyrophosphoryl-undecaprenol N-acetylglucosamine transferase